jgi:hypothetical protein
MYIPGFTKIASGIHKLIGWAVSETHSQHGDRISLLQESRLKIKVVL